MTPSPSKLPTSFIDGPYVQCLCECVEPYFAYCREGVNRSPHAHDLDMPWRPTSWLATLLRNDVSTKIPTSQTWFAWNIFTAKEDSSLNIQKLSFLQCQCVKKSIQLKANIMVGNTSYIGMMSALKFLPRKPGLPEIFSQLKKIQV